jgi:predicted secreted Zn-dependent protease
MQGVANPLNTVMVFQALGDRRAELRVERELVTYPVVGRTLEQRRRAMRTLGPVRHGVTFPAYTDWWLGWSFAAREGDSTVVLSRAFVTLRLRLTIPSEGAHGCVEGVGRAWGEEVAKLRAHEERHALAARREAELLARGLLELSAYRTLSDLTARVNARGFEASATQRRVHCEIDRHDPYPIPFQESER